MKPPLGTCDYENEPHMQESLCRGWRAYDDEPSDLAEWAMTIISNAHGGDWSKATDEWRCAAEQWLDEYLAQIKLPKGETK
jgi:DNA-directed RNA polymerase specialized sigma24 family protein